MPYAEFFQAGTSSNAGIAGRLRGSTPT